MNSHSVYAYNILHWVTEERFDFLELETCDACEKAISQDNRFCDAKRIHIQSLKVIIRDVQQFIYSHI